jgi:hypothetical protein
LNNHKRVLSMDDRMLVSFFFQKDTTLFGLKYFYIGYFGKKSSDLLRSKSISSAACKFESANSICRPACTNWGPKTPFELQRNKKPKTFYFVLTGVGPNCQQAKCFPYVLFRSPVYPCTAAPATGIMRPHNLLFLCVDPARTPLPTSIQI